MIGRISRPASGEQAAGPDRPDLEVLALARLKPRRLVQGARGGPFAWPDLELSA